MLLCIDFQPAYAEAFVHAMKPLRCRLRSAARRREEVHFIYNEAYSLEGEELGDPVGRVLSWGRKERLMFKNARMLRKNFGWVSHLFREGSERTVAVSILRHLMEHGLSSSAEMTGPELEKIVASSHGDFEGFWDCSPEAWQEIKIGAIALPFVFDGGVLPWLESLKARFTKHGEVVEVTGGFRHRCLDEMLMLMEAGGVEYRLNESLIYSLPDQPSTVDPPVAGREEWEDVGVDLPALLPGFGLIAA